MPHMKTKSREKSHAGKPPGRGNKGRSNRCKLRVAYLSREIGTYSEQVAMEIARFATEIGNWRTLIATLGEVGPQDIAAGRIDGAIIGHWDDQETLTALEQSKIPVVATPYLQDHTPFAQVIPDDYVVGVQAAEHLASKGFRTFAYYGLCEATTFPWERLRRAGYFATLKKLGFSVHLYDNTVPDWWRFQNEEQQLELRKWLKNLPKPIALFTCMDRFAYEAIRMAKEEGFGVPNDIAVCGVDNAQWVCMMSTPRLSSIPLNGRLVARQAAQTLNDLMLGKAAPREPIFIAPLPVVQRESTDVTAYQDPDVAEAYKFIRAHANEPIHINDVLSRVLVSRRSLEMRFKALTRSTLQDEIWRAHVDRARQLIIESDKPMWKIAEESGFRSETVFNVMFKRMIGMTPSAYRRNNSGQMMSF
jgi:LacI family transcriptional regulator